MGVKLLLAAMLLGTPAVMVLGARDDKPAPPAPVAKKVTEKPWLTREAAAELVAPGARPGPLFAGVIVGGSEPPAPIRDRIAAFAKQHGIDIDLEMKDGNVAAIRATVVYDGGFGYEGADMLGLRLDRPTMGGGCFGPATWVNEWSLALGSGIYARVSIRVNRVEITWGPTLPLDEVLARAEGMIGKRASELRQSLGDRWHQTHPTYGSVELRLELPSHPDERGEQAWLLSGKQVARIHMIEGRVAEVSLELDNFTSESAAATMQAFRARWGRPSAKRDPSWIWRRPTFVAVGDEAYLSIMTEDAYRYWQEQATAP